MSDLSPVRREELAETLIDLRVPNPLQEGAEWDIEMSGVYSWPELQRFADALAPLIAGWLAAEREAGAAEALRAAADWAKQAGWPMNTAAPVLRLRAEAMNGGES